MSRLNDYADWTGISYHAGSEAEHAGLTSAEHSILTLAESSGGGSAPKPDGWIEYDSAGRAFTWQGGVRVRTPENDRSTGGPAKPQGALTQKDLEALKAKISGGTAVVTNDDGSTDRYVKNPDGTWDYRSTTAAKDKKDKPTSVASALLGLKTGDEFTGVGGGVGGGGDRVAAGALNNPPSSGMLNTIQLGTGRRPIIPTDEEGFTEGNAGVLFTGEGIGTPSGNFAGPLVVNALGVPEGGGVTPIAGTPLTPHFGGALDATTNIGTGFDPAQMIQAAQGTGSPSIFNYDPNSEYFIGRNIGLENPDIATSRALAIQGQRFLADQQHPTWGPLGIQSLGFDAPNRRLKSQSETAFQNALASLLAPAEFIGADTISGSIPDPLQGNDFEDRPASKPPKTEVFGPEYHARGGVVRNPGRPLGFVDLLTQKLIGVANEFGQDEKVTIHPSAPPYLGWRPVHERLGLSPGGTRDLSGGNMMGGGWARPAWAGPGSMGGPRRDLTNAIIDTAPGIGTPMMEKPARAAPSLTDLWVSQGGRSNRQRRIPAHQRLGLSPGGQQAFSMLMG